MSILTLLGILFTSLVLSWAIWFVIEFIYYIVSGEYEADQRLRNFGRRL